MGSSKNPVGKRVFDDKYEFPQDTQALADDIWDAYVTRADTSAARGLIPPGHLRDGIVFRETDTGLIYLRHASEWSVVGGRTPIAVMRRTSAALTFGYNTGTASGEYKDISTTAAWTSAYDTYRGFGTYSNGLPVTVPGEYEVFWSMWLNASAGGLVGIGVNQVGTPGGNALHAIDHVTFRTVALGNASARVRLAATDKLTLWGYGEGGAHAVRGATSLEPMHWGARWVAP